MITAHTFRSNDIRGIFGRDFDLDGARDIGRAFGTYLLQDRREASVCRVLVARDGRVHGKEIQDAFILGLEQTGISVSVLGIASSPLLYFSCREGLFDGGVMITASHNPKEYNGFKMMREDGITLGAKDFDRIQEIAELQTWSLQPVENTEEPQKVSFFDQYADTICGLTSHTVSQKSIVVDAGNGVMGIIAPQILRRYGYTVHELYCEVDGTFPNHPANPEDPENMHDLVAMVREKKASLGIAFDGDGDRLGVVDTFGNIYSSDHIFLLLVRDLLTRVSHPKIVCNVSLSSYIGREIMQAGGSVIECKVGHSFVKEVMKEESAILGGESSGHFFFAEQYYGFDDGLLAALKLLHYFHQRSLDLHQIRPELPELCISREYRVAIQESQKHSIMDMMRQHCEEKSYYISTTDGIKIYFSDGGWLLLRTSNTNPELKFRAEAFTKEELNQHIHFARALIHQVAGIVI